MVFIFLRLALALHIISGYMTEKCYRTEVTKTRIEPRNNNNHGTFDGLVHQRDNNYDYNYESYEVMPNSEVESVTYQNSEVESETFHCTEINLPLSIIMNDHCGSCRSILVISSLANFTIPPLSFTDHNYFNTIYMDNLGITEISPAAFNSLNHLQQLYLSKNNISRLPEGLFNSLTELEILDISSNKFQNLSKHFLIGLRNLQLINISDNHLVDFDAASLYSSKKIKVDLSFNRLTKFNFNGFSAQILYLNLSHNDINEYTGCLSVFEIINMEYNKLDKIENIHCKTNTSSIFELNLGHNFIKQIPNNCFDSVPSLRYLYLQNNSISYLPTDIFGSLNSLQVLNLSRNQLKDFEHGVFEHVPNLQSLDLSRNDLTVVKRYFHSLKRLMVLDLSNNHINVLNYLQFKEDLPYLRKISIDGNTLSCEDLINIKQSFERRRVTIPFGNTKSSKNVQGIACNDSTNLEIFKTGNIENTEKKDSVLLRIAHFLDKHEGSDHSMYNFYNSGFKDSNFYKYLESLRAKDLVSFNETEIFKYFNESFEKTAFFKFFEKFQCPVMSNNSVVGSSNRLLSFNETDIVKYFDKDFKNSEFFKYFDKLQLSSSLNTSIIEYFNKDLAKILETLHQTDHFLYESFSKSEFYNFFNIGFKKSHFYQYLQNISTSQIFLSNSGKDNSSSEKLVNISKVDRHDNNYYGILIFVVTLLSILVFVSTVSTVISVKLYFLLIKNNLKAKEQLELIES